MLAGLRDANPVVSLGHDNLESLVADDPENLKAMLRITNGDDPFFEAGNSVARCVSCQQQSGEYPTEADLS